MRAASGGERVQVGDSFGSGPNGDRQGGQHAADRRDRGRPRGAGLGLLIVLALLACKKEDAAPATPPPNMKATGKFVGEYTIESASNPGGGSYSGDVSIKQTGEVYRLDWKLPGGVPQFGVGIESGTALGVGIASEDTFGVVMYLVNGGELNGTWGAPNNSKLGSELLSGPAGLNGTYKIVRGLNPDGSQYQGTVDINPRGKLYDVAWNIPGNSYKGIGVLSGNTFAVGWGNAKNVGVVLYTDSAGKLKGQWGQPTGTELGLETLAKKH